MDFVGSGDLLKIVNSPAAVRLRVFTAIMSGKLVLKATTEPGGRIGIGQVKNTKLATLPLFQPFA